MKNKKTLKEFLLRILNEINSNSPSPAITPTTKPSTPSAPPSPHRRRKLVPDKWPEEAPGPKPKAENKEIVGLEEIIKEMRKVNEAYRMRTLISEKREIQKEMSMNIEDPNYENPHPSVRKGIEGGKKTAFSDSNFFKGGKENFSTLEKIGSEEFNKIIRDVKPFGKMPMQDFQRVFQMMSSIEMMHHEELESLAIRKVKEQFGLPDEISDRLEAKLVNTVNKPSGDTDNLAKDVVSDLEFTEEEIQIIKQHVEKRKIQNALMMGSGFRAHSTFNSIKTELDSIDKRLFSLYEKTMPNVALFMWQFPLEDMMGSVQMMGLSKIKKDENNEVRAEAIATIFPILLHETAKAAIELLFANYLISLTEKYGANVASEIIKQSDVFEDEIWMKRIGPTLWKYLHDVIDYVIIHEKESNYNLVAYLLSDISMMEPEEFVQFMNTIVYDGKTSIQTISKMIDDIERDLDSEESMPSETDEENLYRTANEVGDELAKLAQGAKAKNTASENAPKNFEDMNIDELQIQLELAIKEERYEDAATIVKVIKGKN